MALNSGLINTLALLVVACSVIPMAAGIRMDISISESIEGHAAWFSLSNGPVQRFSVRWENTGSVNCLSRPRIDFHALAENNSLSRLVYTAWGPEEALMSGASREWRLYSALPEGEYAAVLRVYHCNEILNQEPYFFSVQTSKAEKNLSIESVEVHKGYVDVFIRSREGASEVVVLPETCPRGWIFESGEAGDIEPGQVAQASLGFVPVETGGTAVTLVALSRDGSAYAERRVSVSVPQEETYMDFGLLALAVLLLIFLLYVSKNIIKIWRR